MTYKKIFMLIVFLWVWSFIPIVLHTSSLGGFAFHPMYQICYLSWDLASSIFYVPFSVGINEVVIPFAILITCYGKIYLHVRATRAAVTNIGSSQSKKR